MPEVTWVENYNLSQVVTPIDVDRFKELLNQSGYDREKTEFLVQGLTHGFDLCYKGNRQVKIDSPNLPFRIGDKFDMWEKIMKEVTLGRYAGPFEAPPFEHYIQSPIGLVPKDNGTKTRLIFHLSYPRNKGTSVNSNTPYENCRVNYKDFDHAIRRCLEELQFGACYLAKSDLVSAFRILCIRKEDWPLLVMKAYHPVSKKLYYFVDKCLPFGHSISCSLFQKMSDGMEWIMRHQSKKESINYLDDFLFAAVLKTECNRQVKIFIQMCNDIRFPYSESKTEWATPQIVFLGLLIDAEQRLVCIPLSKIDRALELIDTLLSRKSKKANLVEIQN